MEQLIIKPSRVQGIIDIGAAKNAVLPIMAASVLCKGQIILNGVAQFSDIYKMMDILKNLGGKVSFDGNDLILDCTNIHSGDIASNLTKDIRASIFLIGAVCARCGYCNIGYPGGCDIGARPIDIHIATLKQLGIDIIEDGDTIKCVATKKLKGATISLPIKSVGVTENLIMAATLAQGTTIIKNAADEPEVQDLANFINACGGRVLHDGKGTVIVDGIAPSNFSAINQQANDILLSPSNQYPQQDKVVDKKNQNVDANLSIETQNDTTKAQSIQKVDTPTQKTTQNYLHGCEYTPIRDRIIGGTYLVAGAISLGDITICGIQDKFLQSEIAILQAMGFDITSGNDCIRIIAKSRPKPVNITTAPFPNFATDLQAQFMALAALSNGTTNITETIFENRLNTVEQLVKMGAKIEINNKSSSQNMHISNNLIDNPLHIVQNVHSINQIAIVNGVDKLQGTIVTATDLRGGAALIIAGIAAMGTTTVDNIHFIDRGYYQIEKDLQQVGVDIQRVNR